MSKVSGSYESVVRGVSEQVPQDRRSGQHHEQVNMISDPVRGLARRHGSVMYDEHVIAPANGALYDQMLDDTKRHKVLPFFVDGVAYDLIYRSTTDANSLGRAGLLYCFNKDARQFVPVSYPDTDPVLDQLAYGGVSASVNVGKYIFLAGNDITPAVTATSSFDAPSNKGLIVGWVRGGAYSRTYKMRLVRPDGSSVEASYKTVSSSYPNLLDTSDILTSDTDYQKKVNDRTNAYNSEVTKWIGTAAADITPENIAQKLVDSFATQGVTAPARVGGNVVVGGTEFVDASGDDGGDGTLLRVVGSEVASADLVSALHYVGKVVKVRPKGASAAEAYYLKASPRVPGASGWQDVTWREAAGYEMQPVTALVMGTVVGGVVYVASSADLLTSIAGGSHPTYKANAVGDDLSSPLPYMFGRGINYLGIFQDRLVIGSGATLLFSRPGDYLNWFRQSVLTVLDTDPVEIYALGSEDDMIRSSATYDRNLVLFGDRRQYSVNGRQPFTPKSSSIVTLAAYEDAVDAEPQNSGNFVFYAKQSGDGVTSMHQIQIGQLADTPESYQVSGQLDRYLVGTPVQIKALTAPNTVLLRTEGSRYSLYTYAYLDSASGTDRLFDSWSRWEWSERVGACIGLGTHSGDILAYMLKEGPDVGGNKIWLSCEAFTLETRLSARPYADSLRPAADFGNVGYLSNYNLPADACVAFDNSTSYRFLGSTLAHVEGFLAQYPDDATAWVGVQFPAHVTPTNPFIKDRNDQPILNGRLTLGRVSVSLADTGGMLATFETARGVQRSTDFNGRLLGRGADLIGRQPVVTTAIQAAIGKEVRECKYTLAAKDWLPFTVTSIEWTGQWFNNARRV